MSKGQIDLDLLQLKRTRKRFWIGIVRLSDGEIIETHKYKEAESYDFHACMYFNTENNNMVERGLATYFWVDVQSKKLAYDIPLGVGQNKRFMEQLVL